MSLGENRVFKPCKWEMSDLLSIKTRNIRLNMDENFSKFLDDNIPPQADLVITSFLRYSRDFYDAYEDIQESVYGLKQDMDKAVLFESMAFFLFILDFDLYHSNQNDDINDYIFLLCERFVIYAFSEYQGTSFGLPQQIQKSIQHRLHSYSGFLRDKNKQDLSVFFSSWNNPVSNHMNAARGSDIISPEDTPIIISDAFKKITASLSLVEVYLSTVCPFHFGLIEIFRNNKDFLDLPEKTIIEKLARGEAAAATYAKHCKRRKD